jgi:hypothetical protein
LVVLALGVCASSAVAAPSLQVTLDNNPTTLPRSDELMKYVARVSNTGDVATSGLVTLSIELPSGGETAVDKIIKPETWTGGNGAGQLPEGWSCGRTQPAGALHATATCSRSDGLAAGSSYPAIEVIVHLGADAAEPTGTAFAAASGGGAAAPVLAAATYTFTPGFPFGILENSFEAGVFDELGNDYTKAGGHPFNAYTTFGFNYHRNVYNQGVPTENVKDVVVDAPRGFTGNALATPEFCFTMEEVILSKCPAESAVGGIDIYALPSNVKPPNGPYPDMLIAALARRLIYSLEPEFGQPAQFAFGYFLGQVPYTFVPELRADEGYAIAFRTAPILASPPLYGSNVTLCDFGVVNKPSGELGVSGIFDRCRERTEPGAYPNPLITNPTRCSGPPPTAGLKINSWQHPDEVKTAAFSAPAITDCDEVEFEPEAELIPTNNEADSPTGLNVEIEMPIDGVLSPTGVSQANLNTATVTFPPGMSINPATSHGLQACSLAQIKLKSNAPDECPEASKVGTVEIETPLIRETLTGDVYVARQKENPFNSTLGLYMAFDSARDGVRIKVAGRLITDPQTGQLTSIFTENPEARLALKFNGGPRAALVNPPTCGTYAIRSQFSPWSAVSPANPTPEEIVTDDSTYQITSGPNGSPCPEQKLEPKLRAGLKSAQAGAKSPFVFTLSREDGTQRFTGLQVATPEGLTAYLKGIPYCPDAVLAAIPSAEQSGAAELASPACPAASQVGSSQAGAGAGPFPFYAPGKVYLAGPYKGAPVSLAVVTPAVAGPFDLGNVVIRNPLHIDPVTSEVTATSDPVPTILHGILLDVRDIRVALDRPGFTAAPTSCEPMAVNATVSGQLGATTALSSRFQVGGCEALSFKPTLAMRLFGGTHRGAHPKLRAILTPRAGDANIATASVALPHSEFLEQSHIRTICTRVQFAAGACPAGSVYGFAEATTPLLDAPVSGPVYLRSSSNPLPDLVAALRGPDSQPIEVHVAGRIDSVKGGIRSTFEAIPDQPVSSFTLTMQGGKKGLLVNSRNLCKGKPQHVTAVFGAQNGGTATLRPLLQNSCKKARKGKGNKKAQKRHARR